VVIVIPTFFALGVLFSLVQAGWCFGHRKKNNRCREVILLLLFAVEHTECGEVLFFLGLGMKHGDSWKRRATFRVFDAG